MPAGTQAGRPNKAKTYAVIDNAKCYSIYEENIHKVKIIFNSSYHHAELNCTENAKKHGLMLCNLFQFCISFLVKNLAFSCIIISTFHHFLVLGFSVSPF